MYIDDGVFQYLELNGAVIPVSIKLEDDIGCYGYNHHGEITVSKAGVHRKSRIIDRIRSGQEIHTPRVTPFNLISLLVCKLSESVQRALGHTTITETGANMSEQDSDRIAGAIILAHEIGHSQHNQIVPHLMQILGSIITIKEGIVNLIASPTNQMQDVLALTSGISLCIGARVVSEVMADNYARKHAENLLPYIITDDY